MPRLSPVAPENAASSRIEFIAGGPLQAPVLWPGGRWRFLDLCPKHGCLAVEYAANGAVVHAWPYRPEELELVASTGGAGALPYELSLDFSFVEHVGIRDGARYDNGDLLVTFHAGDKSFPYAAGVARIDPAGRPIYFRRDYSHHSPYLTTDGVTLVPGIQVGNQSITFPLGQKTVKLECVTGKPYRDTVNIISDDGRLLRRIDLVTALSESPYAVLLQHTTDPCDPLHLNSVRRIEDTIDDSAGIIAGDLVVSLRNLSAFAIIDGENNHIKRVVRGSFSEQHSVEHLSDSRFVMFDNQSGGKGNAPSRLLVVDLADGSETTIFPNIDTPDNWHIHSAFGGRVSISPDRKHAIISFDPAGKAVEIRLSDGKIRNAFHSLHDVSGQARFDDRRNDQSAVFASTGPLYIKQQAEKTGNE